MAIETTNLFDRWVISQCGHAATRLTHQEEPTPYLYEYKNCVIIHSLDDGAAVICATCNRPLLIQLDESLVEFEQVD